MRPETMCIQAGYEPKNGSPRALPIYQSTTFTFDSTEHVGALFDLTAGDAFYTRLGNPTTDCVEKKIAALEGGVGALCTSSGQAASMLAVMNIAEAGDHIIAASAIYGGTFNLLGVTLKKFGVDVTFVDGDAPLEQLQKEIRPNTKAVFQSGTSCARHRKVCRSGSQQRHPAHRRQHLCHADSVPPVCIWR